MPFKILDKIIDRKIPKISSGLTFFKGPFPGAYYSEGAFYGGKFEFLNRLG